jgi:anti-anti-sigma regulatory factor
MRIAQRQVALALQVLIVIGVVFVLIYQIDNGAPQRDLLATFAGILLSGTVLFLYWRGWKYALHAFVIISSILPALIPPNFKLSRETLLSLLLAPVVALILGRPLLVPISAIVALAVLFIRASGQDIDLNPPIAILYAMIVGGIFLGRLVTDTAHHAAEENALAAKQERARAEQQARDIAASNELLSQQLDQQRQLLDLVATLETPAVSLAEGVLFAPIVGHLDTRRAQDLTNRMLEAAHTQRTQLVILDIAGVTTVDTSVARALLNTASALRLLGCQVAISGVSATVAITLVQLGITLEGVMTVRSPQEALGRFLGAKNASALLQEAGD